MSDDDLPPVLQRFLAALGSRDVGGVLEECADDVVVVDDGHRYAGPDAVGGFVRGAASEFTYTTELVSTRRGEPGEWVAVHRLVGDFPGGQVDLSYRFAVRAERVVALTISP